MEAKQRFEQSQPVCTLTAVSSLIKVVAMLTLALYGLAALHCTLEGVPGFDFLKTCCFAESSPATPADCEGDGCGEVEKGAYRAEEQTASAPLPVLVLAFLSPVLDAPATELHTAFPVTSESPLALPQFWRFACRTAHPPRAPSQAS